MNLFKHPNFDFIRWRWHAIVLSSLVILAGFALMAVRGLPLGVDFSGGTIVVGASTTIEVLDAETGRPRALSESEREALER